MKAAAGLLRRAAEIRAQREDTQFDIELPEADSADGISAEDRREIFKAIEKLATGNRLSASVESAVLRPQRKGFVFPLVVNLVAAALTIGVLFGVSYLFRQRDRSVESGGAALSTAEGKLIDEIRRESESQLQEKDKAISDIQGKLSTLDKERSALAASIDDRVKQRETQLKIDLQNQIEQEKARLVAQGVSAAAVQEQLAKLEAQKTADMAKQLDQFKKQTEAERNQADANYQKLRDEYQANIASLGADRQKILDDAKQREDALRASLDAKTKALESQNAAAQAGLAKAQAQLAQLSDQQSRQQAIEDRILGLYDTIRQALREHRYEDAATGSASLTSFLNDPSVATLGVEQGRRTADLFVADALGTLAKEELDRSNVDTSQLLAQAELLSQARAAAAAGDQAFKAGDLATAQAKYQQALGLVPEILAAHQYFLNRLQDEENARKGRLDAALGLADQAFRAHDYAGAAQRYAEALAYLPEDDSVRQTIVQRLGTIGADSGDRSRRQADTRAARDPLAAAQRDLAAGRWAEANGGFVGLLTSYPLADQSAQALAGITAARDGMAKDEAARAQSDAAKIAALQNSSDSTLSDLRVQNQALTDSAGQASRDRDAARAALADAQAKIADLSAKLQAAQSDSAKAAAAAGAATPAATQAAASGDYQALLAEKNRLAGVAAHYDALLTSYADFARQVQAGSSTGPAGLSSRLAGLYAFLDQPEARSAFPILKDFIQQSLQDYQTTRPADDLNNAASIAAKALAYSDPAARTSFLKEQSDRFSAAGNSFVVDFIASLTKAIR